MNIKKNSRILNLFLPVILVICFLSVNTAAEQQPFKIEAENMTLDGYSIRYMAFASGKRVIFISGGSSLWKKASCVFEGDDGVYSVNICYLDTYNGSSTRKFVVNGEQIAIWAGNKTAGSSSYSMPQAFDETDIKYKKVTNITLKKGDIIELLSRNDYGEYGQFDYIEFIPGSVSDVQFEENDYSADLDSQGFVRTWCTTGLVATELSELQTGEFTDIVNIAPDFTIPDEKKFSVVLPNGMEFIPKSIGNDIYFRDIARGGEDSGIMTLDSYQCVDLKTVETLNIPVRFFYQTGAYDIWLNGNKLSSVTWKYTPIQSISLTLSLKKGVNRLVIRSRSKANRAGQILIGLQFLENEDKVKTSLPFDTEFLEKFYNTEKTLTSFSVDTDGSLCSETIALPARVRVGGNFYNWTSGTEKFDFQSVVGTLPKSFSVSMLVDSVGISRDFESRSGINFEKSSVTDTDTYRNMYARGLYESGTSESYCVGSEMTLKCYFDDNLGVADKMKIINELKSIDSFMDCSEFSLVHMLRLYMKYSSELDSETLEKFKDTLLNFSYWSDEQGGETMVRNSENHSIGFYSCMLIAGQLFPNELFDKSGRTGAEQKVIALSRIDSWLEEIETNGFEEFQSSAYLKVTLNALLNIYDFCEDSETVKRVGAVIDDVIELAALNTFDGISTGVQGRVYREVVYPEASDMQRLVSYLSPKMVNESPTLWAVPLITSNYQIKPNVETIIEADASRHFIQGGTDISLLKKQDYFISSVNIPCSLPNTSSLSNVYKKSETLKQAHIWTASIGAGADVFVNNPGTYTDSGTQRPDYWYGELNAPKIKMCGSTVYEIYNIKESSPVKFTHAFWPGGMFDEQHIEGHFLFARKGEGYIGLWCSNELAPYSDLLVGCEYRAYGTKTAWVCTASCKNEAGSFESFIAEFKKAGYKFNIDNLTLCAGSETIMGWNMPDIYINGDELSVNLTDFEENDLSDYIITLAGYDEARLKKIIMINAANKDGNNLICADVSDFDGKYKVMFWNKKTLKPVLNVHEE